MRIIPTRISGICILESQWLHDERGGFMRAFCERELADAGIVFHTVQTNLSRNLKKGTLRGMHYQTLSAPEPKIMRCIRGAIYDVALDMRPGSNTFGQWEALELSAENARALLLEAGIAHGFITLTDDAELLYHMGGVYAPQAARTVRWNDPMFKIAWPMPPAIISPQDATAPDYQP